MKRLSLVKFIFSLSGVIFILSGCKVLNPSAMFETGSDYKYSDFEKEMNEYVIKPFDKLDVRIYTNDGYQLIDMESNSNIVREQRTTSPYLVEYDGLVKVPTLGRVPISGLTIKQAEELLEEKYSKFYQKPFVLVNVTNRRVVVFTAGSTKGTVLNIENEKFTLIEALAQAGGIDDFSKSYKIKLLRGDLKDPKVYLFDISSIEELKKSNVVLQANDIIYVEQRPRYTARATKEIMPYITLMNTLILVYITIKAL